MTDNNIYKWPLIDKNAIKSLAGKEMSFSELLKLSSHEREFGTDAFKNRLFHNILKRNKNILNIGFGTDLKLSVESDSGYNVKINIGDHVKEEGSGLQGERSIDVLEPDFSYRVRLTKDEILSVDSDFERLKMFLNKVKDKLEKEILPEVLSEKEKELSKQLVHISQAKAKLREINEPKVSKVSFSGFEM